MSIATGEDFKQTLATELNDFNEAALAELEASYEFYSDTPIYRAYENLRLGGLKAQLATGPEKEVYQQEVTLQAEQILDLLEDDETVVETMRSIPNAIWGDDINAVRAEFLNNSEVDESIDVAVRQRWSAKKWEAVEGISDPLLKVTFVEMAAATSKLDGPLLTEKALPLFTSAIQGVKDFTDRVEANPGEQSEAEGQKYTNVCERISRIIAETVRIYGVEAAQTLFDQKPIGSNLLIVVNSFTEKAEEVLSSVTPEQMLKEGFDTTKIIAFAEQNDLVWSGSFAAPLAGMSKHNKEDDFTLDPDMTFGADMSAEGVTKLLVKQEDPVALRSWFENLPDSTAKLTGLQLAVERVYDTAFTDEAVTQMVALAARLLAEVDSKESAERPHDYPDYLKAASSLRSHGYSEAAAQITEMIMPVLDQWEEDAWTDVAEKNALLFAATGSEEYAQKARQTVIDKMAELQVLTYFASVDQLERAEPPRPVPGPTELAQASIQADKSAEEMKDLSWRLMFTTERLLKSGISDFGEQTEAVFANMGVSGHYGEALVIQGIRHGNWPILIAFQRQLNETIDSGYDMDQDPDRISTDVYNALEKAVQLGGDPSTVIDFSKNVYPNLMSYMKVSVAKLVNETAELRLQSVEN